MTLASQGAFAVPLKKLVFSGALTLICRFLPVGSLMVLCSRILIELVVKSGSAEAWLSELVDAEVVELVWGGVWLAWELLEDVTASVGALDSGAGVVEVQALSATTANPATRDLSTEERFI